MTFLPELFNSITTTQPTSYCGVAAGAGESPGQDDLVAAGHPLLESDRRMAGYGGIGRKRWLLAFEAGEVPMLLD